MIHESEDPVESWDGSVGGDIVQDGVYAYRIVYQITSTGGVREHLGHVTVLK